MQSQSIDIYNNALQERNNIQNLHKDFDPNKTHLASYVSQVNNLINFTQKYVNNKNGQNYISSVRNIINILFSNQCFTWNDWVILHFWSAWAMSSSKSIMTEKNPNLTLFHFFNEIKYINEYTVLSHKIINSNFIGKKDFIYPTFLEEEANPVLNFEHLLKLFLQGIYPIILTPNPPLVHGIVKSPLDFLYHDFIHATLFIISKNSPNSTLTNKFLNNLYSVIMSKKCSIEDKVAAFFIIHEEPLPNIEITKFYNHYEILKKQIIKSLREIDKPNLKINLKKCLKNWIYDQILNLTASSLDDFINFQNNCTNWVTKVTLNGKTNSEKIVINILKKFIKHDKNNNFNFHKLINSFKISEIKNQKNRYKISSKYLLNNKLSMHYLPVNREDYIIYIGKKMIYNFISCERKFVYNFYQGWGNILSLGLSMGVSLQNHYESNKLKMDLISFIRKFFKKYPQLNSAPLKLSSGEDINIVNRTSAKVAVTSRQI